MQVPCAAMGLLHTMEATLLERRVWSGALDMLPAPAFLSLMLLLVPLHPLLHTKVSFICHHSSLHACTHVRRASRHKPLMLYMPAYSLPAGCVDGRTDQHTQPLDLSLLLCSVCCHIQLHSIRPLTGRITSWPGSYHRNHFSVIWSCLHHVFITQDYAAKISSASRQPLSYLLVCKLRCGDHVRLFWSAFACLVQ